MYARPTGLDDALRLMAERRWTVLAGGTDLYPATTARQLSGEVLDIGALAPLRGIAETATHWRIGARTTWTDVLHAPLPATFDALKLAARELGSVQIQNAGTVAGNLCNASPAADGVPPLLVLDAEVELVSAAGRRTLPLGAFLTGARRTARRPDELVTAVLVPRAAATGASGFLKLGARKYLVISIAMAAVRLTTEAGRVAEAAVAVGACSPTARRIGPVEAALLGRPADATLPLAVREADVTACLAPIDDVRGSAAYRVMAATELIRRALAQLTATAPDAAGDAPLARATAHVPAATAARGAAHGAARPYMAQTAAPAADQERAPDAGPRPRSAQDTSFNAGSNAGSNAGPAENRAQDAGQVSGQRTSRGTGWGTGWGTDWGTGA